MASNPAGGPAGPAGPQAGPEGVPSGQSNQSSNAYQQQQPQQGQNLSQNTNVNGSQGGHKLSGRPNQQQQQGQQQQQPEQEQTLGSKYGIALPGVPLEGTNTYTGVQTAEDLSSNLPVIVSADTTVAPTIGRAALGGGSSFGFTGAADQAHSAAYGGSGAANSPEVMAKKAANITTALGVNDHIAGI